MDPLWAPFIALACVGMGLAVGMTRRPRAPEVAPSPEDPKTLLAVAPGDVIEVRMTKAIMRAQVRRWDTYEGPLRSECRVVAVELGAKGKTVEWYVAVGDVLRVLPKDACATCGQPVPERGYRDAERPS